MTIAEKHAFIYSLTSSIRDYALRNVSLMPEEWDGQELRDFLADEFERNRGNMSAKRKKAFRNEMATRSWNL